MGVIQRQTFKNNLLSYGAVVVGAIAQLFIYPYDLELKGYADGLIKWSQLLLPFVVLGMTAVPIRFLPYLETDHKQGAMMLLTRSLVVVTVASLFLALSNFLVGDAIVNSLLQRGFILGKIADRRLEIIVLVTAMGYTTVLTTHLTNFKLISIPVVFNSLLPKIGLPLLILLSIGGYITLRGFNIGLILIFVLGGLGLLLYTKKISGVRLKWGKLPLKGKTTKDLVYVSVFSILGSLGSVFAVHLDTVSVNSYIGDFDTSVYTFAAFTAMVIGIPSRAVNAVSAPIVSTAWKEQNLSQLSLLYQQSSEVLFAIGGYVFIGAVVCLPYVYQITERTGQYSAGYICTILLGLAILFDQITSINTTLIGFTDYYRWNIFFVLVMGFANLILNYVFIVVFNYGITGAALATMLSVFIYNLIKGGFIFIVMKIQPLTINQLFTALALMVAGLIAWYVPLGNGTLFNIVGRGTILTLIIFLCFRYTNMVPPLKRALKEGVKSLF